MPLAVRRLWVAVAALALALATVVVAAPPASAATLTMRVYGATLVEGTGGQGLVAFSVRLSKPATKKVTFLWHTKAGTASGTSGDYKGVGKGTKASIAKGATSTVLFVRITADAIDEYTETFQVHLSKPSSGVKITDADATATIRDDDGPPSLTVPTLTVVEGTSTLSVTRPIDVVLSAPSGKPISVGYALTPGTAALVSDFAGGSGVLTFKPGQTVKHINVAVVADAKDEPDETFGISWSAPVHVKLPSRVTSITLLDDDGPLQPQILSATPPSPSPVQNPTLIGIAPAESTVEFFGNGSCNGAPIASGPATTFADPGITVPMTANTSNVVSVRATNTAGGADTACSDPFTYVHDNIAPAAPSALTSVPASPTQNTSPEVSGHAEAGSTVSVYVDTACSATPVGTFTPAQFANGVSPGTLSPNVTHTIRFTATDVAGNVSGCSELVVLIDTLAPAKPTGLSIVGGSPTTDSSPLVRGTAESGSQVQIWVGASCTGGADASGSAATFAGAGIGGLPTLSDGPHQVVAMATDQAGNVGPCSDPLDFVVDATGPGAPTGLTVLPAAVTKDTNPALSGSAESGSTVQIFVGACTGTPDATGSASAFASASGIALTTALGDGTYDLRARAVDGLGNTGPCSAPVSVTVDTAAPNAPVLDSILDGPDTEPKATGTSESGSTVTVFLNATCAGTGVDSVLAGAFAGPGVALGPLDVGTYSVSAEAQDAAGNVSDCSASISFSVL